MSWVVCSGHIPYVGLLDIVIQDKMDEIREKGGTGPFGGLDNKYTYY